MANYVSGPILAVLGAIESAAGRAREIVGRVSGREDIIAAGQAQQDKGDAQRDAGKKETEANAARAAAKANETRESAEQSR